MPLPIILGGIAIAATAFGIGKARGIEKGIKLGFILSIGSLGLLFIGGIVSAIGESFGYAMWDFFGFTDLMKDLLKLLF